MVRDGYLYGAGCLLAAALVAWLAAWPYAVPLLLLATFFLWFFRDPERQIPTVPGALVSPGDGKVTDVSVVASDGTSPGTRRNRIQPAAPAFTLKLAGSASAELLALNDPTLFALPHRQGSDGLAPQRTPRPESRSQ